MQKIQPIIFDQYNDSRGHLTVAEIGKNLPFEVRRFFILTQTDPQATRGLHANRYSQFFFVCVQGSVRIQADDGGGMSSFTLDTPLEGLYLGPMTWKEIDQFSEGAVLLTLSDLPYDAKEYIRNYEEFLKEFKK